MYTGDNIITALHVASREYQLVLVSGLVNYIYLLSRHMTRVPVHSHNTVVP